MQYVTLSTCFSIIYQYFVHDSWTNIIRAKVKIGIRGHPSHMGKHHNGWAEAPTDGAQEISPWGPALRLWAHRPKPQGYQIGPKKSQNKHIHSCPCMCVCAYMHAPVGGHAKFCIFNLSFSASVLQPAMGPGTGSILNGNLKFRR